MPSKKVPMKGEPDFTHISDEKLNEYKDFIQQMIHSYKGVSNSDTEVLTKIWNDLKNECAERLCKEAIESVEKSSKETHEVTFRKIKPIRIKR